ncbi:MAG: plasmid mobilization relaxosome protein MobC [Bifidobacterium choerinum]
MTRRKQRRQDGTTRDRQMHLRASAEDIRMMRRVSERMGMTVAHATVTLFRRAEGVQKHDREERESPQVRELKAIRTQIWRIGHNINQIARNTNRDMNATQADEAAAVNAVRDCRKLLAQADEIIRSNTPES